jgi:hypothetical protein
MNAIIAIGLVAVASFLIALQLKFFRDGDRKHAPPSEPPAIPAGDTEGGLKNPIFRSIWKNMDLTRLLMDERQERDDREKRIREKTRLKLPDEEETLLLACSSPFGFLAGRFGEHASHETRHRVFYLSRGGSRGPSLFLDA